MIVRDARDPSRWKLHDGCSLCLGGDKTCRPVKVVLTVAHLDHDPSHADPARLKALCQRCHLVLDAPLHAANARRTRQARKAAGELPGLEVRRG
ncbi:MAG: hypothetical protein HC888_15545 [Candidatus Competibacteraceae bacterium]|nr:hypothetical protein [Candidatus Competibacteraceae bacterium]